MISDDVLLLSSEEERDLIIGSLTESGNWMEEDGYFAETKVCTCTHVCISVVIQYQITDF